MTSSLHRVSLGVSPDGGVYLAGQTWSTYEVFVRRYGDDGTQRWEFTGTNQTYRAVPGKLVVDSQGNVYLPATALYTTSANSNFITLKLDKDGVRKWAVMYDGPSNSHEFDPQLVVHQQDYVYVFGGARFDADGGDTDYGIETVLYDPNGVQKWSARHNLVEGFRGLAARVDPVENSLQNAIYVSGGKWRSSTFGNRSDIVTIRYAEAATEPWSAKPFRWENAFPWTRLPWCQPMSDDKRSPTNGCTPPRGCVACSFAANKSVSTRPSDLDEIRAILERSSVRGQPGELRFEKADLDELRKSFANHEVGAHYDSPLKDELTKKLEAIAPEKSVPVRELGSLFAARNALELDRRVPEIPAASVAKGPRRTVELGGVARVTLEDVAAPGKLALRISNGIPAEPVDFVPGWPLASYRFEFTGQLAENAGAEISLYYGGLRLSDAPSRVRLLEWTGESYRDVTTRNDTKRSIVTGHTKGASVLIVATREDVRAPEQSAPAK